MKRNPWINRLGSIVAGMVALLYLIPVLYTVMQSFMELPQLNTPGVQLIPRIFSLNQYYFLAFFKREYFLLFLNSVKITGAVIAGQLLVGVLAAFVFAKLSFPGQRILFSLYILVALLPFQVTLVPNVLLFNAVQMQLNLKLLDTHWAIILPGIFSTFGIFLLRQFIVGIPTEYIEAAKMDGAGHLRIFFSIVLPLIKPAVFTLVMLTFIDQWNVVEQAFLFLESPEKFPLSIFLEDIFADDFPVFYAAAVLYLVPAVMLFFKGQKYLREGLGTGGLK
jgi:multiple sugar transport system permease protein